MFSGNRRTPDLQRSVGGRSAYVVVVATTDECHVVVVAGAAHRANVANLANEELVELARLPELLGDPVKLALLWTTAEEEKGVKGEKGGGEAARSEKNDKHHERTDTRNRI